MKLYCTLIAFLFHLSLFSFEPVQETTAYWNGQIFCPCNPDAVPPSKRNVIEERTLYFKAPHLACYGHALIDGVISLYSILKSHDLLEEEITLIIPVDSYLRTNKTFANIVQLLRDCFNFKRILFLDSRVNGKSPIIYFKRLILNEHVPTPSNDAIHFSFYRSFPDSFKYINELKSFGIQDGIIFRDRFVQSNIVSEFVEHLKKVYRLDRPMIKNRILITDRKGSREIINQRELVRSLEVAGYQVVVVDFEKLSIKDQILETMQSEYFIGTYGSNLVNALFLSPEASVVVLWHKYAKYFWSRRYCVIHSAFLSRGIRLIEYDKPDFDPRDIYTEQIHVPEYFYRFRNANILRPEKVDLDEMIRYPLPAMYEITNVNLYIDSSAIIELMIHSKNLSK